MRNNFFYLLIITLAAVFPSCDDFISKDISGEAVVTLSPTDGDTVASYSQLFWWEEIEGAEEYHLQIVKPSFSYIQQLLLDTTIAENKFSFSLQPGTYQWRVRALNNAGFTSYTMNTLTVDSILDLTSQTVQLISPANNITVSNLTQTFQWHEMPFADSYTFQVLTPANGNIYIGSNITSDTLTYSFTTYGTYKWRVWASNGTSSSHYSERNITIQPAVSVPYAPANGDTLLNTLVNMSWTRPSGGSIIADSLIIAEDASFSNIVYNDLHTGTTYTFPAVMGQQYYWRLRSKTSGGIFSNGYSTTYTFYVGQ